MWAEMCRLYLQMRRQYHTKINSLKTFNTVRFFCVCVMTDPHPEDNAEENYQEPLTKILNVDADICCALAYVVLKLMKNPPTQVSYFLTELEAKYETEYYVLDEENKEFEQALSFIKQKKSMLGSWQIDLWPHPTNISSLPSDKKWWNDVSCGFTSDDLYCMLNFWPNNADKLKVLERMRQAGMPEHQYVEIRSEIMTLDEEGETAEFQENFLLCLETPITSGKTTDVHRTLISNFKCLKWLSKPHRTEKRRNTFNPRMTTIWKTTNRNRRK